MRLLIKNGRVMDPRNSVDDVFDVMIERGKIRGIAPDLSAENCVVIDATNKVIVPGLIDMHVHLRQPGRHEYKETIRTGSRAAAKGGFTTVVCEPNTDPPIDDCDKRVDLLLRLAKNEGIVNVYAKACITKKMEGKKKIDVKKVVEQGAVAITDDGFPVTDIELMVAAARDAKKFGIPVCPHCEESRLVGRKEAFVREQFNSESEYIRRYIHHIVKETQCHFHFPHVSTRQSVDWIAEGKKEGLPITAEVTPHHLTLTKEDARNIGPNAIVNPPLRGAQDVDALKKALRDDIIDVIASDHAPHAPYEKESGNPPFGIIGLETTLGIVLTHLVRPGLLSLNAAIAKMTANPARILNLKGRGELSVGMPADITIIDLDKVWKVDVDRFESKGRNCPFAGWELKGQAVMTIVGGKVVMSQGKVFDPPVTDPSSWQQLRLPI